MIEDFSTKRWDEIRNDMLYMNVTVKEAIYIYIFPLLLSLIIFDFLISKPQSLIYVWICGEDK